MQAHTVERVESWDSRPFSGGFRELHDLADREFSGAVVADDTWLFMLNGRVIGVFEGDVDDFGDASGTVYEAPHPSVALLFAMQERGGETQAKYYTNDTPLSTADDTLSDASFTGYIELSENVLSGDYYVVYYGGRSMSAAFVGASEDLITGEEAFQRADDEVGVYEVKKTPVNVTSIPDAPDDDATGGAAGAGAAGAGAASAGADAATGGTDDGAAADAGDADAVAGDADVAAGGSTADQSTESSRPEASQPNPTAGESESAGGRAEKPAERAPASGSTPSDSASGASPGASGAESGETTDTPRDARASADESTPAGESADDADAQPSPAGGPAAGEEGVFDEEAEWQNAKSVPTLDPEKSESTDGGSARAQSSNAQNQSRANASTASSGSADAKSQPASGGKPRSTVEKLKRAVKQRDAKLEEASERIGDLESDREELRERVETLRAERDELQSRVSDLEAELEAVEPADDESTSTPANDLAPAAALSGTNLFVRYDSKGKPTLDGLDLDTDPAAVNENLRIDHHTQFEAADATVDGEDFESFLESTAAYRFVSWAVRELPFEVRDSGHAKGLADLFEAIPDVDRAELDGTVEVETEDGAASRTFDVVLRDRMGEPLVVAELNAEREPVTGGEMEELVDAATTVSEGAEELSAAMYVTASFFEPAALETADEATGGGGFLSRSDKESFVKVGRKAGYHLCLVEDRNDAFHLTVPEL